MKKITALVLTAFAVIALALLPTLASVESDMQTAVGSENPNAQFKVNINAPAEYKAGDEITVTVTVDGIKNGDGLTSVEFELNYDNTRLALTNTSDKEGALDCIKKLPPGEWENFCCSVADEGLISCGVLTFGYAESAAVNDGDIAFSFSFNAANDASGDLGLYIKHSSVSGSFNAEADVLEFIGNGGYAVISERVDAASSEAESSSTESSSTESSAVQSSSAIPESGSTSNESSKEESSTVVSGESSAVSDVSTENSDTSGESSLVTDSSIPESSASQNEGGESSGTRLPSFFGAASSVTSNGETSSQAHSESVGGASGAGEGMPYFAVPIMIVGGIVLVILVTVVVLGVIDKKNKREAINSVRRELDVD